MLLTAEDLNQIAERVADVLAARGFVAAPPTPPTPAPAKWAKLPDFMRRWSMSRSALYKRLAEGLPAEGEGRLRRIDVEKADAWMVERGHGGRRGDDAVG